MARTLFLILLCLASAVSAQEIEVDLFEGGEGLSFYRMVARELEQNRPGVMVDLSGAPAISDKVRMRILEGDLPEVTNANVDVWSLIEHGYLQPLDGWLDSSWRDSFLPGALDQYTRDGKTYGIPLVYVVWSVYYNKALFREHGWEVPNTWPRFLELCEEMKASGVAPVAFQGRYSFYARALVEHTYFHTAGRARYAELGEARPEAFRDPAMVKSLQLLSTLASDCFQSGFQGMSHTEAQLEFFQGRAAMLFCGSWLYSEMQDNIPEGFEMGAFPFPLPDSPNAQPGAEYVSSGYFFVFQKSAHPELGVAYLQQLTDPQTAQRFAAERGIPVAVKGANEALNPAMSDVARQLAGIKETFGPRSGPTIKGLDQVWIDALGDVLAGKSPLEVSEQMAEGAALAGRRAKDSRRIEVRHPKKTAALLLFFLLGLLLVLVPKPDSGRQPTAVLKPLQWSAFLLPALLVFTLFFALPSLVALGAALFQWDGLGEPTFVGLFHLKRLLLESDLFWSALGHNLILMVVPALIVMPLALFLASLLSQGVPGQKLFRVAFFFPNLIGVAGILLWQQLYNPNIGPINRILVGLGLEQFDGFAWLSNEHLYYALIPMAVWAAAGFNMVLFLAAMQAVPQSLYEAAEINGANAWQKFRHITLPLISETLAVATVLMVIGGMKAFEAIWLLTNQAPTSETHVVGTLMVRSLFVEQRIGQAAALATLLFAVVLVGSVLSDRLVRKEDLG